MDLTSLPLLRIEGLGHIHEEGLIKPPVPGDPFALPFPRLHRQQHVQWIAGQARQTEDNDAHDPESQETLEQADGNIALHARLFPAAPGHIHQMREVPGDVPAMALPGEHSREQPLEPAGFLQPRQPFPGSFV